MSFGPSQAQKNSNNTANGITQSALTNSTNLNNQGTGELKTGGENVNSGTSFFNTLLHGNSANTASLLAPSINQARETNQNQIQALSTLAPRGGGRSSTLFGAQYAPSVSSTNMFNTVRGQAAQTLPQIGLAQEGIGTNLFNAGNTALNTGSSTNANLSQQLLQQQQMQNQLYAALGQGIFGLATTPFGGAGTATAAHGLLGLIPGGG